MDDKQTSTEKNNELLGIASPKIFNADQEQLRWKNFKQLRAEKMYDIVSEKVFPFIKDLHDDNKNH